ncbi:hypothetical protein LV78_000973 [Actinosynnema pretiosum]|nr:hypothetical protein [Actinosynnema pretiosum]
MLTRLHRAAPDGPLPEVLTNPPPERRRWVDGEDKAQERAIVRVLDAHFADPDRDPAALARAARGLTFPLHGRKSISAAARRAGADRAHRTGLWLVRHGTAPAEVMAGLTLLVAWLDLSAPLVPRAVPGEADAELVRVLALDDSCVVAALSVLRGLPDHLLWVAERSRGWERVLAVEEICRSAAGELRHWLLRHACDGDYLNHYFVRKVAERADLEGAMARPDADDALVDHTGVLLVFLAESGPSAIVLHDYEPARRVLAAHAAHLSRQRPTWTRYRRTLLLLRMLLADDAEFPTATDRAAYAAVLDRDDWRAVARAGAAAEDAGWWGFETVRALGLRPVG